MRITGMAVMMAAAGLSVPVHGCALNPEATVIAYLQNDEIVPLPELRRAQGVAAGIFSGIGVHLEFRTGAPRKGEGARCPGRVVEAIEVSLEPKAPSSAKPGELAYATLYKTSGVRIHVFYDRVLAHGQPRNVTAVLLGHVFAHEITHVLRNVPGHSPSGLMKAHWEKADYDEMAVRSLPFADVDVNLIRAHFAKLESRSGEVTVAAASALNMPSLPHALPIPTGLQSGSPAYPGPVPCARGSER
jgi:hypothetical protein